jgi:5'-3' exonuclease
MGVPAFFRKLTKKHKIITFTNNRKIDYLYIDANCLVHPQCFLELEQNIDETNINILNSKMFILYTSDFYS